MWAEPGLTISEEQERQYRRRHAAFSVLIGVSFAISSLTI
jgi:hypothetical protein